MENSGKMKYAIVIVVVVIVAIVLSVALLSGQSHQSVGYASLCTGATPNTCSNAVYNHATGNLSVSITQNSGYNWTIVNILFVPSGTAMENGVPVISWNSSTALTSPVNDAAPTTVVLKVSGPISIGASRSGSIWAQYKLTSNAQVLYVEIGNVIMYAV